MLKLSDMPSFATIYYQDKVCDHEVYILDLL